MDQFLESNIFEKRFPRVTWHTQFIPSADFKFYCKSLFLNKILFLVTLIINLFSNLKSIFSGGKKGVTMD